MQTITFHLGLPKTATTFLQTVVFVKLASQLFVHRRLNADSKALVTSLHRLFHSGTQSVEDMLASDAFAGILERAAGRDILLSDENSSVRASGVWLEGYQTVKSFRSNMEALARGLKERGIATRVMFVVRRQDDWIASRYAESSKLSETLDAAYFRTFLEAPLLAEIAERSLLNYNALDLTLRDMRDVAGVQLLSFAEFDRDPRTWLTRLGRFLVLPEDDLRAIHAALDKEPVNVTRSGRNAWTLKGSGETIELSTSDRVRIMSRFAIGNSALAQRIGFGPLDL